MKVTTSRLDLIPATLELLSSELEGLAAFRQKLGVEVPQTWPPGFYDRPAIEFSVNYLKENLNGVGWGPWYLILHKGAEEHPTVIGTMGFKGKPTSDGTVEIGYSVLEEHQRLGYATEAAHALVEWAFSHPEVKRVIAETYPELKPSIRVMEKNGFKFTGNGSEPRVIRFELTRESFQDQSAGRNGR